MSGPYSGGYGNSAGPANFGNQMLNPMANQMRNLGNQMVGNPMMNPMMGMHSQQQMNYNPSGGMMQQQQQQPQPMPSPNLGSLVGGTGLPLGNAGIQSPSHASPQHVQQQNQQQQVSQQQQQQQLLQQQQLQQHQQQSPQMGLQPPSNPIAGNASSMLGASPASAGSQQQSGGLAPNSGAVVPTQQQQQQQPQQNQQKEFNIVSLCRFGQETVQDILSRFQEVFAALKSIHPPSSNSQLQTVSATTEKKVTEQFRTIRLLFKRLRLLFDKCNDSCQQGK